MKARFYPGRKSCRGQERRKRQTFWLLRMLVIWMEIERNASGVSIIICLCYSYKFTEWHGLGGSILDSMWSRTKAGEAGLVLVVWNHLRWLATRWGWTLGTWTWIWMWELDWLWRHCLTKYFLSRFLGDIWVGKAQIRTQCKKIYHNREKRIWSE